MRDRGETREEKLALFFCACSGNQWYLIDYQALSSRNLLKSKKNTLLAVEGLSFPINKSQILKI